MLNKSLLIMQFLTILIVYKNIGRLLKGKFMVSLNPAIDTSVGTANYTMVKNQSIPFRGEANEVTTEEDKKPPVLLITLAAAATILTAGAGHKTYSVSKALKDAGIKDHKISLPGIFGRNLNPVNWFKKEDAIKKLTDIKCTKIGDSGMLYKTEAGDVVLLDRSKVFKVKSGEGENVEDFKENFKKSVQKPTEVASTISNNINPKLIQTIKDMPEEATEESVNKLNHIILKDMGFDPEKLKMPIRWVEFENLATGCGQFDIKAGELLIAKQLLEHNISNSLMSVLLRHELDHFEKLTKIYKKIGATEYEKFANSIPGIPETKFNKSFWDNATENLDIKNFDHTPYIEGLKKQKDANFEAIDKYGLDKASYMYLSNPLEKEAYKIQNDFEKALDVPVTSFDFLNDNFPKIDSELDKIIKKNPSLTKDPQAKNKLYSYFFSEEMTKLLQKKNDTSLYVITEADKTTIMKNMAKSIQETPITKDIITNANYANIVNQMDLLPNYPKENLSKALQSLNENIDYYLKLKDIDPAAEKDLLVTKIHLLNKTNIKFEDCVISGEKADLPNITIPDDIKNRLLSNSIVKDYLAQKFNGDTSCINYVLAEALMSHPLIKS